ncbi:MAG: hypothetical protein IIA89_13415 [Chloroflexi bacterium]|nr:hypothetical protein [Chloroflexota bacterium]
MTQVSHPEHIREMAALGDPNALGAHPVMVSTIPLAVQLARLEEGLPQVCDLVDATAPQDPRHGEFLAMQEATEQAIAWLQKALR